MSNPNMEAQIHELMELKRMKEELEAEIAAAEDAMSRYSCFPIRDMVIYLWKSYLSGKE